MTVAVTQSKGPEGRRIGDTELGEPHRDFGIWNGFTWPSTAALWEWPRSRTACRRSESLTEAVALRRWGLVSLREALGAVRRRPDSGEVMKGGESGCRGPGDDAQKNGQIHCRFGNIQLVPSIPRTISTGCPELDRVWARYAIGIVERPGIAIADTDDDLTWHAFLGHSIDMQGFRAAEFVGVDALTRNAPGFVPLRQRGVGVSELAGLWNVVSIRDHLLHGVKGVPLSATLDVLRAGGGVSGTSLAEALERFPYRKGHWTVRALLQNSAVLESFGFSFREWLQQECGKLGVSDFPPPDFRHPVVVAGKQISLEAALRLRLEATFYQVGPALAPYMICDWQLWLWLHGVTAVFANFKWDSFQDGFVERYGHGVVPSEESEFASWWLEQYPDLPPRLANECIWLGTEEGIV